MDLKFGKNNKNTEAGSYKKKCTRNCSPNVKG